MMRLSVLMITKNAAALLAKSLDSIKDLADEIIVIDDNSQDNTAVLAKQYGAQICRHKQESFGGQRIFGINKCSGRWILMLDADEILTPEVKNEIRNALLTESQVCGFRVPFLNHFLGHELRYGGETYSKLILFRKEKARIVSELIHERAEVDGIVADLHYPVLHYSYRSLGQTFAKFTLYARNEADRKLHQGEKSSVRKLVAYPIHMFAARYIKDKGYRDHPSRILLDLGFAYMEFLTYLFLLFPHQKNKKS